MRIYKIRYNKGNKRVTGSRNYFKKQSAKMGVSRVKRNLKGSNPRIILYKKHKR